MTAYIDKDYEVKTFENGQFYQLVLELINYIGTDMTKCDFRISYTVDDITIMDKIDIQQLAEIKELCGKYESLSLNIGREAIRFYCYGTIRVFYCFSVGLEQAKDIIAMTENILQLRKIQGN